MSPSAALQPGDPDSLELPASASAQLALFVRRVRESPHNLLSARALEELEHRHIPECLGFAAVLPESATSCLDVGSGGGFPGIPVAIARPSLQVTLLDSTTKKAEFLDHTARELGLSVAVLDGRAESLVSAHAGMFDIVTARAVAPLHRLVPWTLPFAKPGGLVYAIKGERWADELKSAGAVLRRARARVVDVVEPGRIVPTSLRDAPDGVTPRVVIIRAAG